MVCSVGRPDELGGCLRGLRLQTVRPRAILVVAQRLDVATQRTAQVSGAELCIVEHPGLAFAIESALGTAHTEICAFIDDDARAHPDWIARIADAFRDPALGAIGGRDNVNGDADAGSPSLVVGRITRTGKIYGNHHLGHGPARGVDTFKGANMAVRVAATRDFPLSRLVQGEGAQYRNELILAAEIRRRGYQVVYDPAIQVDHFPAARGVGDDRKFLSPERISFNIANELTALRISEDRMTRMAYIIRQLALGNKLHPGLARVVAGLVRGDMAVLAQFGGSIRGLRRASAVRDLRS